MSTIQATQHDLGDGVTVVYEADRVWGVSKELRGAAYVRFNGEYRFTCSNLDEAKSLKRRAMFLPD